MAVWFSVLERNATCYACSIEFGAQGDNHMRQLVQVPVAVIGLLFFGAGCLNNPGPAKKQPKQVQTGLEVPGKSMVREEKEPPPPQFLATFNTGLARNYIPYVDERREAMIKELTRLEAEAVCLQEVWEPGDAHAIIDGVKDRFPHVYQVAAAVTSGSGGPPCPGETLEPLAQCVQGHCAEAADKTGCTMKNCGGIFLALPSECRTCLAVNVSKGMRAISETCTRAGTSTLGYDGNTGLMLLSRTPFLSKSYKPLDSFLLQRAVLHARITVIGGPIHLFCTHLSTPVTEVEYTGRFESWKAEQAHQIEQIVAYMKETATRFPAVLMGDLNCGPANAEWEVAAEFPDNFNRLLDAGLLCPYCEDHGHCTFCGHPELGGKDGPGKLIDHLLFMNFGDGLLHPERILESPVAVKSDSGNVKVPISDHYGVRCSLDVPFVSSRTLTE